MAGRSGGCYGHRACLHFPNLRCLFRHELVRQAHCSVLPRKYLLAYPARQKQRSSRQLYFVPSLVRSKAKVPISGRDDLLDLTTDRV